MNAIQYVRVADVVGSINPLYAMQDSLGHIVNDPWPTAFSSGGFDLDAVGVIHQVPEPAGYVLAVGGLAMLLRRWLKRRNRS